MRARYVIPPLILLLLLLAFAWPAAGQSGIIVNGADAIRETTISRSTSLETVMSSASARVIALYANGVRRKTLVAAPGALQTALGQVSARVVAQFSNAVRHQNLVAAPGALQTTLAQVSNRVIFAYANANRAQPLSYPATLLADTTKPQAMTIAATATGQSTARITWTTNEFATSVVLYGTQSGQLTQTVSDPLYLKTHELTLTGLTAGTTYFYKIRSTDQSGNTIESTVSSFTTQSQATPTPTHTPTATVTNTPTNTPTATATPRVTRLFIYLPVMRR
ncbi:MAG: fibronectin type III domain-containing protein [Ardenticatenales bacterium]|nr:fibronectin type III domain-containing protein [Ardenticatenales bacterium]